MKKEPMTVGQLTQIYDLATQRDCGKEGTQALIQAGHLADLFAADPAKINRLHLRRALGLIPTFKTWRSLELGTFCKIADMIVALKQIGCADGEVKLMLEKVHRFSQPGSIDLVKVQPKQFGVKDDLGTGHFFNLALDCGLELCPWEVGPLLRLAYTSQPLGEGFDIAMKGIDTQFVRGNTFGVYHYTEPFHLSGGCKSVVHPNSEWIFVKPRD